jgi:hypothetical protein
MCAQVQVVVVVNCWLLLVQEEQLLHQPRVKHQSSWQHQ